MNSRTMKIDYFKFEIKPWDYHRGSESRPAQLEIQVNVNGHEEHSTYVMPNIQPFETELARYVRAATEDLHQRLRGIIEQDEARSADGTDAQPKSNNEEK